ncbi:MAG: PAS domain S-box protein [Kiritimatiellae bacterium]|nr:PAS domain S-box protein [Kiritimatiellia bacterium]
MKTRSRKTSGRASRPPAQPAPKARKQAAWLAAFPEKNSSPVLRVAADGILLYCNPAATRTRGWVCAVGQPLPVPLQPLLQRALSRRRPLEQDVELSGKVYSVSVVPLARASSANVYGRDVTARRRAEESLRQLNAELEQRVAEQTSEIRKSYEIAKAERQRLYDVLETLPAYVVLLSKDYHVPFANRFFRERFGESHGRQCFDYLFGRREPCENCESYKAMETHAPHHWEWTGPDGRDYDIHDFPFADTDGSPMILEMGLDVTDRKKAEVALKEANETLEQRVAERTAALKATADKLRIVADFTYDWEYWRGPDNRLLYVSPSCECITGYTREEFVRDPDLYVSIIHPDDRERMLAHMREDISQRDPSELEFRIIRRDGQVRWISHVCQPVRDADGNPMGRRASNRDITERKLAEEAVRQSEEKYRLLFHNMAEGFALYELIDDEQGRPVDWRVLEVNEAYSRHTGIPREQIVGRRISEVFPASVEEYLPRFANVVATRTPADFETFSRAVGRHMHVVTFPAGGRRFASIIEDISERKRAQEALRASEAQFRAVFESSSDCILVWDREYNYLYANQAAIDYVGTTRDKVVGKNIRDGLGHMPDFMRLWMGRVDQAFASGEPFRVEDTVAVGGRRTYSESVVSPIRDAAGAIFAVSVVYRDVTDSKLAERDLRASEAQLKRSQEIAHLGSWELDLDQNRLTWSDEVYRIFGLQPQEFGATYEAFLDHVHPDDRAAVDAAYSGSVREGRAAYEIEHRVVRSGSGEIRIVHERCEHFRDASGRIVRSVGMVHDITERKQAQEAVLRAKQEWERTFDSVPDLIAILDEQHRIVRANRAMAERLGVTVEKCVGMPCYRAVHGADSPIASCPHVLTLTDGKEHVAEVHEEHLGGDFLITTTPLHDESGRMIGAVHMARDITDRKRAEERAKEAAAATAAAQTAIDTLDAMGEGVLLLDMAGRIQTLNPALERMSGFQESEVAGRSAGEILHEAVEEKDRSRAIQDLGRMIRGEVFRPEPLTLVSRQGLHVPVIPSVSFIRGQDGRPTAIVVTIRDISELKKAESEVRRASAYNRRLIEASLDPLVTIGPEGKITDVNAASEAVTGCTREELIGSDFSDYFTEPEKARAGYQQVFRDGLVRDYPLEIRRRDGQVTPVLYNASVYHDEAGDVIGVFAAARDITERRRMEAEKERYQQRLRDLAERLASTEDRERRRISTQIHDSVIQTLSLCNIKMGAHRKELADAGLGAQVEGVNTIRAMIEEAITESRSLMAELTPPLLYELGLVPALQDLTERLQKLHGAPIRVRDDGQPKAVDKAIEGFLFQATRELMLNALKHAGPCSVTVDISRQDDWLRIRVEDDGSGFEVPGDRRFVFHRSGGFGLFTIGERLNGVGGRVDIQSRPGEGTRADLFVPLTRAVREE